MGDSMRLVNGLLVILFGIIVLFLVDTLYAATPQGPDSISYNFNETKDNVTGYKVNVSGGRIVSMNLSANVQNTRWKAFVGHVTGTYSLDDATGNRIFNWSISTLTGRVYATRNSSTISWGMINCSNISDLENENTNLQHSNPDDNITKTFNTTWNATSTRILSGTHNGFYVASRYMANNTCPTLNTFISNNSQEQDFEEMALWDNTSSMVYATILESDVAGYDNTTYDFQMIVPENGNSSWQSATAYYLYVELGG